MRQRFREHGKLSLGSRSVKLALHLYRLKEEMAHLLGQPRACAGCGRGHLAPHGYWAGGFCCGGKSEDLFTDNEILALLAAGVTARQLALPPGTQAGCLFRGPRGCSSPPGHRPSMCLSYSCRELRREIAEGELVNEVIEKTRQILEHFEAFERSLSPDYSSSLNTQ